jgi:hypothetical protein
MDARDFLSLAGRLAGGSAPAELRTAVGRSYYAVFNVALETLRGLGFAVGRGAAAHGEIQKCLGASGNAAIVAVASKLNDLHKHRNRADYQLDRVDVENAAAVRTIVNQAAQMVRTLDATFSGSQRPQLQAAILNWRRANGYP